MARVGVITIGQSPRTDMVPEMAAHWTDVAIVEGGALDGWSAEQITAVPVRADDEVLTSRLADGASAVFGRDLVLPLLQERIAEAERQGVDATLLVCTGEFPDFDHVRPLFTASQLLVGGVRALATGTIGVICPLEEQRGMTVEKFAPWSVVTAVANPYGGDQAAFHAAAESLVEHGATMIVLDCMGYTEQHRALVRERTSVPVVVARSMVARLFGEVVA